MVVVIVPKWSPLLVRSGLPSTAQVLVMTRPGSSPIAGTTVLSTRSEADGQTTPLQPALP